MKYPQHKRLIHKGQVGKVLVIGGSPQYYGAPILTALGGEAAGSDLIHLYTCPDHLEAAKSHSLNFFLHGFAGHTGSLGLYDVKIIHEIMQGVDAVTIGNGIGKDFDAKKAVLAIINTDKPIVIDAEALVPEILKVYNYKKHRWILTPHSREFERVFGVPASPDNILEMSKKHRINLCVTGPTDYIVAGNDFYSVEAAELLLETPTIEKDPILHKNHTGVPQMRVGGTGDVLAGIICSYLSQGFSASQAMKSAAYLFGKCGEAFVQKSATFSAKSLVKFFPKFNAKKTI
jgi:hydroxyethylthiazole kinase-like uncharacterized protein yjeF